MKTLNLGRLVHTAEKGERGRQAGRTSRSRCTPANGVSCGWRWVDRPLSADVQTTTCGAQRGLSGLRHPLPARSAELSGCHFPDLLLDAGKAQWERREVPISWSGGWNGETPELWDPIGKIWDCSSKNLHRVTAREWPARAVSRGRLLFNFILDTWSYQLNTRPF